jgi:hypothetical protein
MPPNRPRVADAPFISPRLAWEAWRAALAYVGRPEPVDWAGVAAECGYADQSHLIAEFREFSGLAPVILAGGYWYHPFIERARRRHAIRTGLSVGRSHPLRVGRAAPVRLFAGFVLAKEADGTVVDSA